MNTITTPAGQTVCRSCWLTHDDGNYDFCPRWDVSIGQSRLEIARDAGRKVLADFSDEGAQRDGSWYPYMAGRLSAALEILLDTL